MDPERAPAPTGSDGGLFGGMAAGVLAFVSGILIPQYLSRGPDLAPLPDPWLAPVVGLAGGILGRWIGRSRVSHVPAGWMLALLGTALTGAEFQRELGTPDSRSMRAVCFSILPILGVVGLLIEWRKRWLREHGEGSETDRARSEGAGRPFTD